MSGRSRRGRTTAGRWVQMLSVLLALVLLLPGSVVADDPTPAKQKDAASLEEKGLQPPAPEGGLLSIAADGWEPDDTAGQANEIYSDTPQTHSIDPASDQDWYTFPVCGPASVELETSGPSGDTDMWLYDSLLQEIDHNDDYSGLWSYIDRVCGVDALWADTYYVNVSSWGGVSAIPSYDMTYRFQGYCADGYEWDDALGTGWIIADGQVQNHTISPIGDNDVAEFTLTDESAVIIETSSPCAGYDTRMWLFDAGFTEIDYNDDGGSGYFSRITRDCGVPALPPGTYYILVDEFGDNDQIAYDLSFSATPCPHDHWGEYWSGSGTGLTLTSTDGPGVWGVANHTTWTNYGVYGLSQVPDGDGVHGDATATSGVNYGVYGETSSDRQGIGIFGFANAATGTTDGIHGVTNSPDGYGVFGHATTTANSIAVGVYGIVNSPDGAGVAGLASAASGVTYGVEGVSRSPQGRGVYGSSLALSGSGATGVYGGVDSPDGWAGRFTSTAGNGVYISVPANKVGLTVAGGSKNAVVPTSQGDRLLYVEEATEVWFADYGVGWLVEGKAEVMLDPIFMETVNVQEPYHVFLQAENEAELFVSSREVDHFVVQASAGDLNAAFAYRVVARRLGHEGRRLERAEWADEDPNLYPEKAVDAAMEETPYLAEEEEWEPEMADHEQVMEADLQAPEEQSVLGTEGGTAGAGPDAVEAGHTHRGETWSGTGTGLSLESSTLRGWRAQVNGGSGDTIDGLYGINASTSGIAVYGRASASSGRTYGVYGISRSTEGSGLAGTAHETSGVNFGVLGQSDAYLGRGVYGYGRAVSGSTVGVYGETYSTSGTGVSGLARGASGVTYGAAGESRSVDGFAVYGYAASPTGNTVGVLGVVDGPSAWAGKFLSTRGNGVYISAAPGKMGLSVVGGTKNAVVPTTDGARLLYAEESSEVWFADYGFGQVQEGAATIAIDPTFAETVNLGEPYHVFVQAYGDAQLVVSERTADRLAVKAVQGEGDVLFSYRVVARRLGREGERLERAEWDDQEVLHKSGEATATTMSLDSSESAETVERLVESKLAASTAEVPEIPAVATGGVGASEAEGVSAMPASLIHNHWGETWTGSGTGLAVVSSDSTAVISHATDTSGATYAVVGDSTSSHGSGVFGSNTATTGESWGVWGRTYSTQGYGAFGWATYAGNGVTYGAYGFSSSTSGRGVYGVCYRSSGVNYGVYGLSRSLRGWGVYGRASATTGPATGLYGVSASSDGTGVYGYASSASGTTATGVFGRVYSPDGWAGQFTSTVGNGVLIDVPVGKKGLNVVSGSKNAVVPTSDGARLLYAEEATEVWFTDYGFGRLADGAAYVAIDPLFGETVNLDQKYLVFVQSYGEDGLYVANQTARGFEVRSVEGAGDFEFSYRLAAKRLGHEGARLERAEWADSDPNL